jgi:hypothetical protein
VLHAALEKSFSGTRTGNDANKSRVCRCDSIGRGIYPKTIIPRHFRPTIEPPDIENVTQACMRWREQSMQKSWDFAGLSSHRSYLPRALRRY